MATKPPITSENDGEYNSVVVNELDDNLEE
jgi:hypothetical protein